MRKLNILILVIFIPFLSSAQGNRKDIATGKSKKIVQGESSSSNSKFMTIIGKTAPLSDAEKKMEQMLVGDNDISHTDPLRKSFKVSLDFGHKSSRAQQNFSRRMSSRLHSMTDAVNVLINSGWEFFGSDIWVDGDITYYHYYMIRSKVN